MTFSKRLIAPTPPPSLSLPPVPSNPFSHIIAWASLVQPGSPAPPSAVSYLIDIPKSSATLEFDLTALGYNSLFVHLPKTPSTPSPYLRPKRSPSATRPLRISPKSSAYSHIPIPPIPTENKRKLGMKRIRSLTILRPKTPKSQPPPSPTKTATSAANIAKRKRAKYANVRPPPPLANELALMQFADGGSMDANIKRVMEAQAKAAAGSRPATAGVADVYRDGNGGVWWDADEEMEYVHLLDGAAPQDVMTDATNNWVQFPNDKENDVPLTEERRSSLTSVDSELDPANLMPLPEHEPTGLNAPVNDRVLASQRIGAPGMALLSLPARPRREARHLRRAEFLVDKGAFAPFIPRSPINVAFDAAKTKPKPRGKARRRPAPLKLVNSAHHTVKVIVATNPSPVAVDKVRRDFLDNSFKPLPLTPVHNSPVVHLHVAAAASQRSLAKPSRLNMRSFFSRRGD
ncbi:hypothetical protein CVT24_005347 [Panaeolus cyanescens]|uniref:Uncharacterized protein n=1 Tax=Panaeolus cyanescens TaxID=181874 RepID=A0A409Y9B4_9AGAR|nr:hypothetical protein CVT24_005347 [Panaeolus cyanescens]